MAASEKFSYDSAEEDWDLQSLQFVNLQLENYLKMLPGGVDLTLTELQDMAARQQHQIESQQQVLVAKEQRLKYLKQQEQKHQHVSSENDRLRKLRDRVEAQEMKLKKLRALRGQVEQYKATNGNYNSELETVKALFNEKEKELAMAVTKVDELTRQLEGIQKGNLNGKNGDSTHNAAAAELEKLRKELMLRNKLNDQQNSKLLVQTQVLNGRKDEVLKMDRRIHELQNRLKKKRAQQAEQAKNVTNQQTANKLANHPHGNKAVGRSGSSNIAAVEPYVQHVPKETVSVSDDTYSKAGFDKQNPKYQSLPPLSKFSIADKSDDSAKELKDHKSEQSSHKSELEKLEDYKIPLVVSVDANSNKIVQNGLPPRPADSVESAHGRKGPPSSLSSQNTAPPVPARAGMTGITHLTARPFGTTYSTSVLTTRGPSSVQAPVTQVPEDVRPGGSGQSSPASSDSSQRDGQAVSNSKSDINSVNINKNGSLQNQNHTAGNTQNSHPNKRTEPVVQMSHVASNENRDSGVRSQRSNISAPPVPSRSMHTKQQLSKSEQNGPSLPASTVSASSLPDSKPVVSVGGSSMPSGRPPQQVHKVVPEQPQKRPVENQNGSSRHDGSNRQVNSMSKGTNNTSFEDGPETSKPGGVARVKDKGGQQSVNGDGPASVSQQIPVSLSNVVPPSSGIATGKPVPTYRYASKSVIENTYMGRVRNEAVEKYQKNFNKLYKNLSSPEDGNQNVGQSQVQNEIQGSDPNKQTNVTVTINPPTKDSPQWPSHSSNQTSVSASDLSVPVNGLNGNEGFHGQIQDQLSPVNSHSSTSPSSPNRHHRQHPFGLPQGSQPYPDIASDKVSYKPNTPKNIRRRHSDSDNEDIHVAKLLHKFHESKSTAHPEGVAHRSIKQNLTNHTGTTFPNGSDSTQATSFADHIPERVLIDNMGNMVEVRDVPAEVPQSEEPETVESNGKHDSTSSSDSAPAEGVVLRKKTNLKGQNSSKSSHRVSFDPLALLLDASLEGELDLVQRCAREVPNVSASNDEGITALHNAICAGHYDIVTFLVEFGCDVNSPDSDGWTPLHCAASCNNLPMVKFLVEHGACIFATTISDHETAAEKCEEDEDGYDGCSEYLYSIQEKLGIMNQGTVYGVFDFSAQSSDELSFKISDTLTILRKGDENEKEWWWARKGDREGYIPRNLLGLHPRVLPRDYEDSDS